MSNYIIVNGELHHHGIKGMKWGVRRFQTKDGSLTPAGRKRYNDGNPVKTALKKKYGLKDDKYELDEIEGRHNPKHMAKEAKASKTKRDSELRKEYGELEDQMTYGKNANAKKNAALQKRMSEIENELNPKSERKGLSDKQKKALKVGAAVAGTALAAYGTYKLASYMQDKRHQAAMTKARDYVDNNLLNNIGQSTFKDGTVKFTYANKAGDQIVMKGARNQVGKAVGQRNAKTIATGRQIYRDATNTKLDKGLAGIVNAGDAVGNTAKRAATSAGNTAKRAATSARNAVLDVVNPIYEYTPGATTSNTRTINGLKVSESVTEYYKNRKRR